MIFTLKSLLIKTSHVDVPKGLLKKCLLLTINIVCYLIVGGIRSSNPSENVPNSN